MIGYECPECTGAADVRQLEEALAAMTAERDDLKTGLEAAWAAHDVVKMALSARTVRLREARAAMTARSEKAEADRGLALQDAAVAKKALESVRRELGGGDDENLWSDVQELREALAAMTAERDEKERLYYSLVKAFFKVADIENELRAELAATKEALAEARGLAAAWRETYLDYDSIDACASGFPWEDDWEKTWQERWPSDD